MKPDSVEGLVTALYVLVSLGLAALIWRAIQKMSSGGASRIKSREPARVIRSESKRPGLQSDILKEGSGPKAKNGDTLTVHYTAFLPTGENVDSSHDRRGPVTFKLGAGKMINGWEVALVGAQAGEVRKVVVPSNLAYGKKGSPSGKVPPDTDVTFDIELLKVSQ